MQKLLKRFRRSRDGMAAAEFAMLLPVLLTLFFGVMEFSLALACRADVANVASTAADLVAQDGTIAVMSSGLGSIAQNQNAHYEAYRTSKAALNMGLASIAARRGETRTWLAVDPGWVRTDMGGPDATLSIEESIPNLVTMLERRAGKGGLGFVSYQDRDLPW